MDLKQAKQIIKKVREDYDSIALEWDDSRALPRASQIKIAKQIRNGQKVLDIGCGNAVFYSALANKSINYTGLDISRGLLAKAQKNVREAAGRARAHFVKGEIPLLPFNDSQFDWVCAFAVLHHVPGEEWRQKAASEMHRVLKTGGRAAVSVWNLFSDYAEKKFGIGQQLKQARDKERDALIPWLGTPGKKVERYMHVFTREELADLFKKAGFKKVTVKYVIKETGRAVRSIKAGNDLFLTATKGGGR